MKKKYFGKETEKAISNFSFRIHKIPIELIYAIVEIKRAAAIANYRIGDLEKPIKESIVKACDEILKGKYDDQFPTPALQGGAGTSINMNVNEVIASRATEILGKCGKISVHPNDHVNKAQSTNDVNPSALKIACIRLTEELGKTVTQVSEAFKQKAKEYNKVPKLGRTHLQDAVPTTIGEEFRSYAFTIERGVKRIKNVVDQYFYELSLGGTAIGNSINAPKAYIDAVYRELFKITGLKLQPGQNLMSPTSSQTDFCMLGQSIVLLSLDLSKIASDLRLLSSGPRGGFGEVVFKELQAGSSIMPGKVNPILAEAVNQLYYFVSGANLTMQHAAHCSQLELANMFPILADRLITILKVSRDVYEAFAEKGVKELKVNQKRCKELLERSNAYATLLTPKLGYDVVSKAVKESIKTGRTLREIIVGEEVLTEAEFDQLIDRS